MYNVCIDYNKIVLNKKDIMLGHSLKASVPMRNLVFGVFWAIHLNDHILRHFRLEPYHILQLLNRETCM